MGSHVYVACDLGAENCRVMLGTLTGDQLVVEEVHRFPNGPVSVFGTLRWDVLHIFDELKNGLRKVVTRGNRVESMSNDSWGLDFVYIRGPEPLLTPPYHYRDRRMDGGLERAFAVVPAEDIYSETGIQFMQFNSLYQLLDDLAHRRQILELSERFLGIGDYFNYLFSGVRCAEESLASTTQLLDPRDRSWAWGLIERFGLPARIFPKLAPSGTILGPLLPSIAEEVGLEGTKVVASCSHDTAAAIAAVPAEGEEWAYISSGTWSLLGIEAPHPIINAKGRECNFSNEIGYHGTVRFLKNITGLWIVRECRREWAKEGREYTYDELTSMAEKSEPLKCFINTAERRFVEPNDMPRKVIDYCRETGQMTPRTEGEIVRCILESLALQYHQTLLEIEMITGRRFKFFHIVGGGSKNSLLNQLTADATKLTVLAGPTEATAIGNILVQAIALGQLGSLIDIRRVVRRSFPITTYQPRNESTWENANERFKRLTAKSETVS